MAETTPCAEQYHPITCLCATLPQSTVDRHTRTQHRGRSIGSKAIRNRRHVVRRSSNILLERAGGVVSGDLLVEADAVVAGQAGRTAAADPRDPFDADSVPDLDVREVGSRTQLDDFAYTLVPADLTRLRGEWEALPRVGHDAEVGVADAGVYKDLARPWLGHVEVDELCRDLARLIVDRGLVLLR
ncbi:alcohol dehydrogenase [Hortaea werneckii]|nr:alcohol dehydrogenase [Hortaea werneckii]